MLKQPVGNTAGILKLRQTIAALFPVTKIAQREGNNRDDSRALSLLESALPQNLPVTRFRIRTSKIIRLKVL